MSLLYKDPKDIIYSVDIKITVDSIVRMQFTCDGGKHGTDENIDEFEFTVKELLLILQKHDAGSFR